MPGRRLTFLVALCALAVLPATASAVLVGPSATVPGGPGSGHGGRTCLTLSDNEAALGKTAAENATPEPGQTFFIGGGRSPAVPGCPFVGGDDPTDLAVLPPFDTTRFAKLYWGPGAAPEMSLNGDGNTADLGEKLTFLGEASNRAGGILVFGGQSQMTWCQPSSCSFTTSTVTTRLTIAVRTLDNAAVPLLDPESVGLPAATGGVVEVTPELRRFKVVASMTGTDPGAGNAVKPVITMFNGLNHPPPGAGFSHTQMSFAWSSWYENRAPVAGFSFPPPSAAGPVTFTDTSADPDGAIASYGWDLDNDGQFDDGAGATATATLAAGTHTVRLRVIDDEGAASELARTVTVPAPAGADGPPSAPPPAGSSPSGQLPGGAGADRAPPSVRASVPRQRLAIVLKKGLRCSLTSDEAGSAKLALRLSRAQAKRLRLRGALGTTTVQLGPGTNACLVRLSPAAKRRLKRLRRLKVVLTVLATDAVGNAAPGSVSISLKR